MVRRKINVKKMMFRLCLILLGFLCIFSIIFNSFKDPSGSINKDTKRYKNKTCTVYYPNNKAFLKYANDICSKSVGENTYDYALIPYGDYYLVSYSDSTKFIMDKNNNPLEITSLSNECREVISDYLRYDMQKEELDEYFTIDFYEKTYYKNLDLTDAVITVNGINIDIYLPAFDRTVSIPISNLQKYLKLNLGSTSDNYVRPHYVSSKRKTCVFTFDDGPSSKNSDKIIDTLYKYGANATFFVLGNRINQESVGMIKSSISKGNEYGSHTENKKDLITLEDDEVLYEIMSPADLLANGYKDAVYDIDGIDYHMKYYRPPFGSRDERIDNISPLLGILWDIDSEDWLYKDSDKLFDFLMELDVEDSLDRKIVIMHDSYAETVDGVVRAIEELTRKGYQFVNITEFLRLVDFDYSRNYY